MERKAFWGWLFLLLIGYGSSQKTDVCHYTPEGSTGTGFTESAEAIVNSNAVTLPSYAVDVDDIYYMGTKITTTIGIGTADTDFNIELTDTATSPDQVNISLTFTNVNLVSPVTNVTMDIDLGLDMQAYWDSGIPVGSVKTARSRVVYSDTSGLGAGASSTIYFLAEPAGEGGTDLPEGLTNISATVTFVTAASTYGLEPLICVERDTTVIENIFYQQGFTALTFFIMFFVGIGLGILGVFLFLLIRKRRQDATISPANAQDKRLKDKGKKIVMDAKTAMRRGANAIKDFSLIAWNDSIVFILSMKDKLHMFREIDNLDILSTIEVDTDLEKEQSDASVQASLLLVEGLRHNGDVSPTTASKAESNMQARIRDLDKKLDISYKKDLEVVYTDIEAKNKEKLGELLKKHKEQRNQAVSVMRDLPEEEKKQMVELMDNQQQAEESELTYKLALEQNEEAEKLRKEFAIRKRMGIKDIQQQYITDVIIEGKLSHEKADWLIKQHKQQQDEIHRKYDEEISRQRMNLEEKLARRRALARASETQEDDNSEMLNLIASIHINLIQKLKKTGSNLSEEEIDEYLNQARTDLMGIKAKLEKDKDQQEQELFKKLSQTKRKSLAIKINEHSSELQDFIRQSKAQQAEGPVDPVSYVDKLVNLKSRQRKEVMVLENQLDEEHAKELETARDALTQTAKIELKAVERTLVEKLKDEGMKDEVLRKILQGHEKTVQDLEERQLKNRRMQETKLKEELARRKREWEDKRAEEKKEQQELRDHESEVVEKLLSSQVAISEAERDRILKEHEKNMVKLENSLTLNKLRQQRMLEEKIAGKRARQMEELQQKQNAELSKQRKIAENNGEEDDEETHRRELALMKKHAEQRMALIQGQELNFDEELSEIRLEMTKERALALKDQEERLGAMIASLQMDKAREMSKIEEQQKAINNLKANLMDDLNARGVLSTPECEKILNMHKEEQDKLHIRLDTQRAKQENRLKKKLAERIQQRENTMVQKQENEMRAMLEMAHNKSSAKIRRMLLMHKHMVEMEKFRTNMDREISQTLEHTKRDFDLQKTQISQEQELQFIAGLVKIGNLTRNELLDVLHMLFPGKTEESLNEMLNKIYQDSGKHSNEDTPQSTLAHRIYTEQYSNPTPLNRRGSVMSLNSNPSKKKLNKKGTQMSLASIDELMGGSERMERNGSRQGDRHQFGPQEDYARRSRKAQRDEEMEFMKASRNLQYPENYEDDDEYPARTGPQQSLGHSGRLPPLRDQDKPKGKKKKKKFLKNLAHHEDPDDDDLL